MTYGRRDRLELLDKERITAGLSPRARAAITTIELHRTLTSTNDYLLKKARQGAVSGTVCLAEQQTAGRGRRGNRVWQSPFGTNIYLSLLWRLPYPASRLSTLSIACAIAAVTALRQTGAHDIGLKWPNDILWRQRKLCGILIDLCQLSDTATSAVIGVGVNVRMPTSVTIDQPWVDLHSLPGAGHCSRNTLTSLLISQLAAMLIDYQTMELAILQRSLQQQWQLLDLLYNRAVTLSSGDRLIQGIARGIDHDGALRLLTDTGIQRIIAGELSLRPGHERVVI